MEKKAINYIKGSAMKRTGQYGEFINLSLLFSDLEKLPKNDQGYIRLTVAERREPSERSTHSVYEDTFVPTKKIDSVETDVPF